jgi:hypothetical protein
MRYHIQTHCNLKVEEDYIKFDFEKYEISECKEPLELNGIIDLYITCCDNCKSSFCPRGIFMCKCKGKVHPRTGHEGPEGEQMYSSTLPSSSALAPPAALPRGNTRYPLCRRLCGLEGRSGRVRKISPPPGFDPQTVQSVGSCSTD